MFDLDEAILEWRSHAFLNGLGNTELLDELESHLRDDVSEQMRSGISTQAAFNRSVEQMGEVIPLRQEFAKACGVPGPIFRALFKTALITNIVVGSFLLFGGVAAMVSFCHVWTRGIRFEANDWRFLAVSWSLSVYGAICGLMGILAAIRLFKQQRSGIRLGKIWALAASSGILADVLLRSWIYPFTGFVASLDFLDLLFGLYPVLFGLFCRNLKLKEQYA